MSNKSQLQANNTQLSSLIQTLQGKAAGGGSGSGGSVETCTGTIKNDAAVGFTAYYVDSSFTLQSVSESGFKKTATLSDVVKGSIIIVNGANPGMSSYSGVSVVDVGSQTSMGFYIEQDGFAITASS